MCMGCSVTALDITVRKDGLTRIQSLFYGDVTVGGLLHAGKACGSVAWPGCGAFCVERVGAVYECQVCKRQYGFKN